MRAVRPNAQNGLTSKEIPMARKIRGPRTGCWRLPRGRPLRIVVDRMQGLAGSHEQPISFGAAKAHIGDDLRQTDPTNQLARGGPNSHAIVTDGAAGITRTPTITLNVAA